GEGRHLLALRPGHRARLQAEARAHGGAASILGGHLAARPGKPGSRRDPVSHRRLGTLPPLRLRRAPRDPGELRGSAQVERLAVAADDPLPAALAGIGGGAAPAVPTAAWD